MKLVHCTWGGGGVGGEGWGEWAQLQFPSPTLDPPQGISNLMNAHGLNGKQMLMYPGNSVVTQSTRVINSEEECLLLNGGYKAIRQLHIYVKVICSLLVDTWLIIGDLRYSCSDSNFYNS